MRIDARKIFVISVLAICVIAINLGVYFEITKTSKENNNEKREEIVIDTALLTENFNNIFDNQINYQENNIDIQKQDNTKELVYTSYTSQETQDKTYELNVNIPYLNLNNDVAKSINEEINNLFHTKAINILANISENTIYSVKYKAYINDNILSLIISATLKEGDNAQRIIMKTYNYNLSSNSKLDIKDVLQYRGISDEYAQRKIKETIKVASDDANKYKELGYNKYLRNTNDKMYKLENTTVYFIGENKAIYIIYPYGNLSYTSEIDLLVI